MIRRTFLALATAGFGVLGANLSAQCLVPDNLSGPCWQPTQANLPDFPQQVLPATGICFQQCMPLPQEDLRIIVDAPTFNTCAQYIARVRVFSSTTGGLILSGAMTMDYTRNWAEAGPSDELSVYRFAVKVDLSPGPDPGTPCTVPSCVPAHQRSFYYGYMDYAFHCSTPTIESALMLFHNCDDYVHRSNISATPGVFHPNVTFALVAPHTLANPFVAGSIAPPSGKLVAEAVRNVAPIGGTCTFEDPIVDGGLKLIAQACGCQLSLAQNQLSARRLDGVTACVGPTGPSTFKTVKTTPGFPWFHQMTTSIGTWTTVANYPGPEIAWADEAPILYHDACSAASGLPETWAEIYYGASTARGYPVLPDPVSLTTDKFLDLASNASFPLPGPVTLPLVGAVFPTRNLIYVNTP